MSWKEAADQKRKSIDALIPSEWRLSDTPSRESQRDVTGKYVQQFLSEREVEITETDAAGIAKKTTTGQWKAVEVIKAFCHRASLAHQLTNCLLEIFFDAAFVRAQELDDYFAKHKKPIGALHGLPISLKDQFHVKGVGLSMGYVGWLDTFQGKKGTDLEKNFQSELANELMACGAVFYCKTSVPPTLMSAETNNNIVGYCWNPKNRHLSAGGSSGGEGALIGIKGSPLGFGTDIGGSIRIPSGVNGLYGIRPSAGRLPYEGMANSMDGQNTILSVVGPLATSVESLQLVMKAVLSQKPWLHDPLVIELPWRDEQERQILDIVSSTSSSSKLCFGVIRHDGVCTPHPPVLRAIDIMIHTLEKLGHEVIEWKPLPHKTFDEMSSVVWRYDAGADTRQAFGLSGEPVVPQVSAFLGSEVEQETPASKVAATNVWKRQLQKEYMEYWNSTKELTKTGRPVDALICPLAPAAAARPEMYRYVGYTTWVNVVDYTAVTVPVTNCDKTVDKIDTSVKPLDKRDQTIYESYDPELYDGAHVSLQLIGRRLQEEKMLALAKYVGDALHNKA